MYLLLIYYNVPSIQKVCFRIWHFKRDPIECMQKQKKENPLLDAVHHNGCYNEKDSKLKGLQ